MIGSAALRLILDQGVPRDAAIYLRQLGYDCTHVGEIGMSKTADEEILAWSLKEDAAVVTLDADFHQILAVSGASKPSIVRIRMQGLNARAMVELVTEVVATYSSELKRGALVTVKRHKITYHGLPIGRSE